MSAMSMKLGAYEKQAQALKLRLVGMTYDQIAARVGYSNRSAACKAVQRALKGTLREDADALRTLEAERLDAMQLGLMERALRGDDVAINTVLRIMQQRAKLYGLDAPLQVTGAGGGSVEIVIKYADS